VYRVEHRFNWIIHERT